MLAASDGCAHLDAYACTVRTLVQTRVDRRDLDDQSQLIVARHAGLPVFYGELNRVQQLICRGVTAGLRIRPEA